MSTTSDDADVSKQLLPSPSRFARQAGTLCLRLSGHICVRLGSEHPGPDPADGDDPVRDRILADRIGGQLCDALHAVGAKGWDHAVSALGTDMLGTSGASAACPIVLAIDTALDPDASHCEIGHEGIVLSAGGIRSLRDGAQTLRQLIALRGLALPCCSIDDRPALPVRAFSLDISRGRVPTLATLEKLADILCLLKYTQLQLYIEDSLDLDQTAGASLGHDPIEPETVRALDRYCQGLGIELCPALATFGHQYEVLRSPRWRHLGILREHADRPFSFVERMRHHTIDPTLDESLDFEEDRLDAIASLFSSSTINIGCDETFDLGQGSTKTVAARIGTSRLYADFVTKLCDYLRKQHKQIMMYGDIFLKYPDLGQLLPKGICIANWDYDAHPDTTTARTIARSGHPQVLCPGTQTWNRLLPNLDAAATNIAALRGAADENGSTGLLLTDWGDYGHINDPIASLPAIALGAEQMWARQPASADDVLSRASRLLFGDASGRLLGLLREAARCQTTGWDDLVQFKELRYADSATGDTARANAEVLRFLGYPTSLGLEEARGRFLRERSRRMLGAARANEKLRDLEEELMGLLPCLASQNASGAVDASPLLLLIEGQILLNDLGQQLCSGSMQGADEGMDPGAGPVAAPKPRTDIQLADRLVSWMRLYRQRWRQTSRESDLRRIQDVIDWYLGHLG